MNERTTGMTRLEEIKEALADLERIERHVRWAGAPIASIRSILESARQEAETWEAIEAWLDRDMHRYIRLLKTNLGIWWAVLRDRDTGNALHIAVNKDRLEVLAQAVAYEEISK